MTWICVRQTTSHPDVRPSGQTLKTVVNICRNQFLFLWPTKDFELPHADIKCTTDLDIDVKTLMSNIEEIILQLDPNSGVCKGRIIRIDEYHHSHLNIELRMFASKERDVAFSNQLISRVDQKAKSLMKSAAHVTVKLEFSPVTYLTGFYDPKITAE